MLTREVGLLDDGQGGQTQTPEYALYQLEYYPAGDAQQFLLSAEIDPNGIRTDYEYHANYRFTKEQSRNRFPKCGRPFNIVIQSLGDWSDKPEWADTTPAGAVKPR